MLKKVISMLLTMAITITITITMAIPVFAECKTESNKNVLNTFSMTELRNNPNITFEDEHNIMPLASEDGYISTLSLGANVWHIGATRSYNYDDYTCTIAEAYDMLFYGGYGIEPYAKFDVYIRKPTLFSFNAKDSTTLQFTQDGQSRTATFYSVGSRKTAFGFQPYSSPIESNKVEMLSF